MFVQKIDVFRWNIKKEKQNVFPLVFNDEHHLDKHKNEEASDDEEGNNRENNVIIKFLYLQLNILKVIILITWLI
jgi:hypothetical protein